MAKKIPLPAQCPARLTDTQKYLIGLVPSDYKIKAPSVADSKEVKAARRVVKQWDDKDHKRREDFTKSFKLAKRKVYDLIYLGDPLAARSALEALRNKYGVTE